MPKKTQQQDTPKKPYISQTQLTMFEKCGEMWRRRYAEGEKVAPGIAMLKGTGVHAGAQAHNLYKLEKRKDLKHGDIVDIAVAAFEKEFKKTGATLTRDEESIGPKKAIAVGKDAVRALAGLFADQVAPIYQPKMVEVEYTIELPESSHNLLSRLDLADERDILVDYKTSTRRKQQDDVEYDEQLSFYALVYKGVTGRLPREVRLETLVEKQIPERQCLKSRRTMDDLNVIIRRINTMIAALRAGVFVPTNPMNWWCNPRWCGYYYTCKYVKGR